MTIIIPRHIHRSREIISELENLNLKVVSHSLKPKKLNNADIYLVDTFGETNKFHKIGSSVFLGGSVIKRGGQNPLEAARYGARILHGPNTDNFRDVYRLLKSFGISKFPLTISYANLKLFVRSDPFFIIDSGGYKKLCFSPNKIRII